MSSGQKCVCMAIGPTRGTQSGPTLATLSEQWSHSRGLRSGRILGAHTQDKDIRRELAAHSRGYTLGEHARHTRVVDLGRSLPGPRPRASPQKQAPILSNFEPSEVVSWRSQRCMPLVHVQSACPECVPGVRADVLPGRTLVSRLQFWLPAPPQLEPRFFDPVVHMCLVCQTVAHRIHGSGHSSRSDNDLQRVLFTYPVTPHPHCKALMDGTCLPCKAKVRTCSYRISSITSEPQSNLSRAHHASAQSAVGMIANELCWHPFATLV